MTTYAQLLVPAVKAIYSYGERLLSGIDSSQFARMPKAGSDVINVNHPAFNYGHLALYPLRAATVANIEKSGLELPENFPALFTRGVECKDDPEGDIYPSMEEIVSVYKTVHQRLIERLPLLTDEALAQINPEEGTRERFPTVGALVIYLLTAHHGTHLGQISGWRRCFGLPGV